MRGLARQRRSRNVLAASVPPITPTDPFRIPARHSHDRDDHLQHLPDSICNGVRASVRRRALRLKEMVQSKRGPSIFQPYRDIWKLFHKDEVVSEETTWIFRVTPYLAFVMPVFVTMLIPVLTDYPLAFAFMGDMLAGGFFLGLAGFFAALAAVDTGNPYGPMEPAGPVWWVSSPSRSS